MLLLASYVFYGFWDWRFLSLIFISTVTDYFVAIGINNTCSERRRKVLLLLSICTNLGLLGIFKYYGFFSQELANLLAQLGIPLSMPSLNIVLPVGISFYTFQTMGYTIDVYRRLIQPTRNFADFALFVSFFPQLVAGPIERSSRLMPQILNPRHPNWEDFREGLHYITLGLFKKVVIADNMAAIVNTVFQADPATLSGGEVVVGVYAFAFQIYGDFSGYSSIAQGVAKWMGIDLVSNFSLPYFAVSPGDFWRRWHVSLSSWFRDYLYIPLGGSRGGRLATYRNLIFTMLLAGLWHGAGWTFLAWGLFHGLLLCGQRALGQSTETGSRSNISPTNRLVRIILMFQLVSLSWLFFRAESLSQAWTMIGQIITNFSVTPFASSALVMIAFYTGPLLFYELWLHAKKDLRQLIQVHWLTRGLVYSYCALMLVFFPPPVSHEFIYFRF